LRRVGKQGRVERSGEGRIRIGDRDPEPPDKVSFTIRAPMGALRSPSQRHHLVSHICSRD
jgi:hypothetical protein